MQSILLSKGEKDFIQGLLNKNLRIDGRGSDEMRPFSIEMNPLPLSPSSCRVTWGHGYGNTTEILASVSTEVMKTEESEPQLSVKSLACSFGENADGTEICQVIYSTLQHFLQNSGVLDPSYFTIHGNSSYSWKLFIDVLVIKAAGAVYEAAMIGIRESLRKLRFPQLIVTPGETISELHFDIDESKPLLKLIDKTKLPYVFSFAPVGDILLRDPTPVEVAVVQSLLVVGFANNTILGLNHFGECGMKPSILSYIQERIESYLDPFIKSKSDS